MKRRAAALLALGLGASAVAQETRFVERLEKVRAEAEAADEAARALEADAANARDEAERLSLETRARAEALSAAEARLSEATIELAALTAARGEIEARLAEERRPLAHLVAGLATLSRRPPLASLADAKSAEELVRLQLLISASLPAIEKRTAALEADLADLANLDREAIATREELAERRTALARDRERFALAEARQRAALDAIEAAAFGASRRGIAIREELAEVEDEASRRAKAIAEAQALASYPAPPVEARRGRQLEHRPPFAYLLPVDAPVTAGLGSVSVDGIRARGLTMASRRGTRVTAPADGTVRFVGALRSRDGVMVIEHGDGWLSLLTGVTSDLSVGDRVSLAAPIGRATGPLGVELWHEGRPLSPALVAGST